MQKRSDKSNGPLLQQIEQFSQPKIKKQRVKTTKLQKQSQQDEYLDTKTSNRILALVKEQQQEIRGYQILF